MLCRHLKTDAFPYFRPFQKERFPTISKPMISHHLKREISDHLKTDDFPPFQKERFPIISKPMISDHFKTDELISSLLEPNKSSQPQLHLHHLQSSFVHHVLDSFSIHHTNSVGP